METRLNLFKAVTQSFSGLPSSWGEDGTDEAFYRAIYGIPAPLQVDAMEAVLDRSLVIFKNRPQEYSLAREIANDLENWYSRNGTSVGLFPSQEEANRMTAADGVYKLAVAAALNGVRFAADAGVLGTSTTCCVREAIHSFGFAMWSELDPEAASAAPEEWLAKKFEPGRWYFENDAVRRALQAEWTGVVDDLIAAGAANAPMPTTEAIEIRERTLVRWRRAHGLLLKPE